jgi:hypothetical protein
LHAHAPLLLVNKITNGYFIKSLIIFLSSKTILKIIGPKAFNQKGRRDSGEEDGEKPLFQNIAQDLIHVPALNIGLFPAPDNGSIHAELFPKFLLGHVFCLPQGLNLPAREQTGFSTELIGDFLLHGSRAGHIPG